MANSPIVGTLAIEHSVDPNGSLNLKVPITVPPAKLSPDILVSYHSAAQEMSVLGHGWEIQAFGLIERTPATIAQDRFAGSINYDSNDRFTLNGQRLMSISGNEYRYEVEQWSKVVAEGVDLANPDSWTEYLPDGTVRRYGSTSDSKLLAVGQSATRIWALAETYDPFSNYASYSYVPGGDQGSLLIQNINYGGNRILTMQHQRKIDFSYGNRDDVQTEFIGGSRVTLNKRLLSISASFNNNLLYTHTFDYDYAPLTHLTRLQSITLSDASGTSVPPLMFNWSHSAPSVFDNMVTLGPLEPSAPVKQVLPADVNGSGRTDLILAASQYHNGLGVMLYLDVYLADGQGGVSTNPQPGSGYTGLLYPDQLLAFDVNGDGKTDLLHIVRQSNNHIITVLLSTENGYVPQAPLTFSPENPQGQYFSGDFQGNGNIGLVYLYNQFAGGARTVRLVQFTSNGESLSPREIVHGPVAVDLQNARVVIADFNGNGASDIFLVSSQFTGNRIICKMNFFESQNGYIKFRGDMPFVDKIGDPIPWTDTTAFLALPEQDGKTGLLLLSRSAKAFLQFRTLRSTGKSFHVSDLTTTNILYRGDINLGHSVSTSSLDLVNTFPTANGTEVSVLHFFNDTFVNVVGVTQPPETSLQGYETTFADLRGVGRADCLFTFYSSSSSELKLLCLPCADFVQNPAGSVQAPADFITGYTGGLGATLKVTYAPLTDSTVYTASASADDASSYINALHGMANFASKLSNPQPMSSGAGSTGRTQLLRFPKYVVHELTGCAHPSVHPEIVSRDVYHYTNGRISFDGRGWLGFETIDQQSHALGTATTNTHVQSFPFIGQISKKEMREISGAGNLLKTTCYTGDSHPINQGINHYTTMPFIEETTYENGSPSYCVDIVHEYDSYANITKSTITTGKLSLVVTKTYSNDAEKWIIGSKLTESITSEDRLMKQSEFKYLVDTQVVSQTKERVSESLFSVQNLSFDAAGNVVKVAGPWQAETKYAYDSTYSFPITTISAVDDQTSLTTTASYDYGVGKAIFETEPNGHITAHRFDVLGREIETSEGDNPNSMIVIEKREYTLLDRQPVCIRDTLCDLSSDSWSRETEYLDGMERTWKKAVPGVSPSVTVYSESLSDGAGRVIRQYRDYTNDASKVYTALSYDTSSRIAKIISPPVTPDVDPVTITYDYSYRTDQAIITQTKSSAGEGDDTVTQTVLQYFPHTDINSSQYVVPLAVSSVDEVGHSVTSSFDALHRLVTVTDPNGVRVSQQWDSLSRLTSRKVSNPQGMGPSCISNISLEYDDPNAKVTITNECTGVRTDLLKDRLGRLIERTSPDEVLSLTYDNVKAGAQGRLSSATSSKGVSEAFSYDGRGCTNSSSLTVDGQTFTTSFEYTASRQLSKIANPDHSVLTRTFFPNCDIVNHIELQDHTANSSVSSMFSDLDNAFLSPRVCDMGNGVKSTVTTAENGVPVKAILSKGSTTLHEQSWKLNSYSRLQTYNPSSSESTNRSYQYNPAGQLLQSQSPQTNQISEYSYDQSGNILSKDGNSYINLGWQLSSITDSEGNLLRSFDYSPDGHLTKEKDGLGQDVRTMTYDSLGRLTRLNSKTFVYDFQGRLVKAASDDGTVTYYPSESYEVTVEGSTTTRTAYLVHEHRRASISTIMDSEKLSETSVFYYHGDHLGSVVAVSDADGNIVTTYSYDDFGTVKCTSTEERDVSRYKYSGKEMFEGLYYFGARFYDPVTGRFTALDNISISANGITPSTFNQYNFSRNDPINYIDVNGNVSWKWFFQLVVNVALIAAGIALMAATFQPGWVALAASVVGSGLFGAGYNGITNTAYALARGDEEPDLKSWGVAVGIGAAFGLMEGGLSLGMASAVKNLGTMVTSKVAGKATGQILKVGIKKGISVGTSTLVGTAASFTENIITNHREENGLLDGFGRSLWLGAALGAGGGALSLAGVKAVKTFRSPGSKSSPSHAMPRRKPTTASASGIDNGIELLSYTPIGFNQNITASGDRSFRLNTPTGSLLSGQSNLF